MTGKRPQRWRFESRGRQLIVERDTSDGQLYVLVVPPALRRSLWSQLPTVPAALEARVRLVTVRGLLTGRTLVPEGNEDAAT